MNAEAQRAWARDPLWGNRDSGIGRPPPFERSADLRAWSAGRTAPLSLIWSWTGEPPHGPPFQHSGRGGWTTI
jgi:hypothetical protein